MPLQNQETIDRSVENNSTFELPITSRSEQAEIVATGDSITQGHFAHWIGIDPPVFRRFLSGSLLVREALEAIKKKTDIPFAIVLTGDPKDRIKYFEEKFDGRFIFRSGRGPLRKITEQESHQKWDRIMEKHWRAKAASDKAFLLAMDEINEIEASISSGESE